MCPTIKIKNKGYSNDFEIFEFIKSMVSFYLKALSQNQLDNINTLKLTSLKTRKLQCKNNGSKNKLNFLSPEPNNQRLLKNSSLTDNLKLNEINNEESLIPAPSSKIILSSDNTENNNLVNKYSIDCINYSNGCVYQKMVLYSNFDNCKNLYKNETITGKNIINSNSLLLLFYSHCFISISENRHWQFNVIFQHNTKTYTISYRYLLTEKNAVQLLMNSIPTNLIQTDIAIIPIHQLSNNWKLIPLFERQIISRNLSFINFSSYLVPNNQIFLQIDMNKTFIIFDKNHGLLSIPFCKTLIHTADFHNIKYDLANKELVFSLKFMEKLSIPIFESNFNKIKTFINACNSWGKFDNQTCSPNFKIYENINKSDKDILFVDKLIMNKNKECLVVLYHDRIEINKIVKKHNIRTYLNSNYLLKYKFILSANIKDVCFETSQYYSNDSLDFCIGLISYIQGNFITVYKNPKIITFTCKSISEKKIWLQYIDYLKIVI